MQHNCIIRFLSYRPCLFLFIYLKINRGGAGEGLRVGYIEFWLLLPSEDIKSRINQCTSTAGHSAHTEIDNKYLAVCVCVLSEIDCDVHSGLCFWPI